MFSLSPFVASHRWPWGEPDLVKVNSIPIPFHFKVQMQCPTLKVNKLGMSSSLKRHTRSCSETPLPKPKAIPSMVLRKRGILPLRSSSVAEQFAEVSGCLGYLKDLPLMFIMDYLWQQNCAWCGLHVQPICQVSTRYHKGKLVESISKENGNRKSRKYFVLSKDQY